jgi:hypothetical protein
MDWSEKKWNGWQNYCCITSLAVMMGICTMAFLLGISLHCGLGAVHGKESAGAAVLSHGISKGESQAYLQEVIQTPQGLYRGFL